jgi:hypothetical protein
VALGFPRDPRAYGPCFDEEIPQEERFPTFGIWISSYFANGDLSTRNRDNLEFKTPDSSKPSVSASLSLVKRTSLVDENAASRSDMILFHPALRSPLFKQTNKALFDPETRAHLPNLGIWVVSCDSSPGINVQSAWELEKLAALPVNKDTHLQFLMMDDAHHLVRNSRHQLLVLMMSVGRCFGMSLRRLWRYLTNVCGAEPQHRRYRAHFLDFGDFLYSSLVSRWGLCPRRT